MSDNGDVSPDIGVILMLAIMVILAAVIAAFVFGMANNLPKEKYVSCSDYYKIVDKYRTPSGFYVTWEKYGRRVSDPVYKEMYPLFQIGGYGDSQGWGLYPVNITPINESVSGMRDSCEVMA